MAAFREEGFPFADLALARRLERAEGTGNREFVEARARAFPESGACWIEVAGAYAMYDGVMNVHFEDRLEDGKMIFDYRMRPGVVERSNALALMRAIGLDV